MSTITDIILRNAKAIVAVVVPLLVAAANEVIVEASTQASTWVALVLGAVSVWATPNREPAS